MSLERVASGPGSPTSDTASLSERLAALGTLSLPEMRAEWRRLYRSAAPRLSREMLVRALAYRIQEKAGGGLRPAISRRLKEYGGKDDVMTLGGRNIADALPKPGTRLVREWNGRTYTVTVTENGFAYNAMTYGSLTKIARVITGAHWSGPRFFGLNSKADNGSNAGSGGDRNA